jgi:hypothetical protein
MLSTTVMKQLQDRDDLIKGPPEPPTALAMARAVGKRRIVWARLTRFESTLHRSLWSDREWTMEADYFCYDSTERALRREQLTVTSDVKLGWTGFAKEEALAPSDNERFHQSEILLREMAKRMRAVLEDSRDD